MTTITWPNKNMLQECYQLDFTYVQVYFIYNNIITFYSAGAQFILGSWRIHLLLAKAQYLCGLGNSLALIKTKCWDLGRKWVWICGASYNGLATAAPVGNQRFSDCLPQLLCIRSCSCVDYGAAVAFPELRIQRRVSLPDGQTNKWKDKLSPMQLKMAASYLGCHICFPGCCRAIKHFVY